MLAITAVIASIVISCGNKLREAEELDLSKTPVQTVENMFAVETDQGKILNRMEAILMERYSTDTAELEIFPLGLQVYGYGEDGVLETVILSDRARHVRPRRRSVYEVWEATGNVVIHNITKQQTMETDTLYWDQTSQEIYTDSYVKMYSPDGFMQGYGMRSDDHARNAILMRPFNSYGYAEQDTTTVFVDSVNFIGPFLKK